MEEYICKSNRDHLLIAFASGLFGICAIVLFYKKNLILAACLLLCALVLLYETIFLRKKERSYIEKLKQDGVYDIVLNDFAISTSLLNDKIRCGANYVFRKKYSKILSYEEIVSLSYYKSYHYDEGKYHVGINIELENKKIEPLCYLDGNDSYKDIKSVFAFFSMKNPNVIINDEDLEIY